MTRSSMRSALIGGCFDRTRHLSHILVLNFGAPPAAAAAAPLAPPDPTACEDVKHPSQKNCRQSGHSRWNHVRNLTTCIFHPSYIIQLYPPIAIFIRLRFFQCSEESKLCLGTAHSMMTNNYDRTLSTYIVHAICTYARICIRNTSDKG